jgi:hypothetical protein
LLSRRTRPSKSARSAINPGLYADLGGTGSTLAAQMAVEDSGLTAKGWKIDVISGDYQRDSVCFRPDLARVALAAG